jgi:O-methyltransferase
MGIAFSAVEKMAGMGLFGDGGISILDIGSSNLYSAPQQGVEKFLERYGQAPVPDAHEFARRIASGSAYDPVSGGRNEVFAGELFEKAGMRYESIDIAAGYKTTILDLNNAVLPNELRGAFDLVLNFGTTEHILNQLNCFRIVHDAAKVGGYIYHSLPAVGYVDHGYVTYTGRCFFDVAGYNEYELVACWFDGPSGGGSVLDSLNSYSSYFPSLKATLENLAATEQGVRLRELRVPDVGINVVYRKTKDKPFGGAIESSTSVGSISHTISATYDGSDSTRAAEQIVHVETESQGSGGIGISDRIRRSIASTLRVHPPSYRIAKNIWRAFRRGASRSPPEAASPGTACPGTANPGSANLGTLNDEESALRDRLLDGRATFDEAMELYRSMTVKGQTFPLDWEERILRMGLEIEPDRKDLLARLRYVLVAQGKTVDREIENAVAANYTQEEYAIDHQLAAANYHVKTGTVDMDPEFLRIYELCRRYSMTSVERMYALYKAIHFIEDAGVEGDIVECGVWRGGSMMVAAHALMMRSSKTRNLFLFDTFEGLPRPDEEKDEDVWGNRAIDGWLPRSVDSDRSHWAEAGETEVRDNLLSTGYPGDRLKLVKGMVERTIPAAAPAQIALLRLDTDWYRSTKHELEHLFGRLSPKGVLIIDDYGHFKGARAAVDEFFAERGNPILLNRVDYSGRVGVKTV